MAATQTPQAKIRAGAKHHPSIASAGMVFFHNKNIIEANVHTHFPLMASQ